MDEVDSGAGAGAPAEHERSTEAIDGAGTPPEGDAGGDSAEAGTTAAVQPEAAAEGNNSASAGVEAGPGDGTPEEDVLKANAVAEYKFVWKTLSDDAETKAMTLNRAKALGATPEELALDAPAE